jgi:hypothetical protein
MIDPYFGLLMGLVCVVGGLVLVGLCCRGGAK